MKLRDYIEKRAASKRQLRLAKKYMAEAADAKHARQLAREVKFIPKSPRQFMQQTTGQMELGRIAETVAAKHRRGREAAKAYAMGDISRGDRLRRKGEMEEFQRKLRMELPPRLYGNTQAKARKAFGKINK